MKKNLLLVAAFMFAFTFANAQFKVLVVDDDNNGAGFDELEYIATAVSNANYIFDTINIDTNASPNYDTLSYYDMVIWTTANDGTALNLWDTTAAVQFNPEIREFIDSNGIFWLDGVDFMYDVYGSAPDTFNVGDFVYDVMGASVYVAQTHADDSLGTFVGLTVAYPTSNNTIHTMDSIKWKWSALWYGDAFDITNDATALFEMGPASYDFAGKLNGFYKDNVITTSLRIGSLGDGSTRVQADIDLLVKEMINAAEAGTFDPVGVNTSIISRTDVNLYPNPATDIITITFPASNNISLRVFDITGKVLIDTKIENNSTSYRMNVSELNSGIYFYQLTMDNATVSHKFSIIK